MSRVSLAIGIVFVLLPCALGYLPGVSPVNYAEKEEVELKVNKLTSVKRQVPYNFYDLPFCRPLHIVNKKENLGEILRGDRISNSLYKINFLEEVNCAVLGASVGQSGIAPWKKGDQSPPDCTHQYTRTDLEKFAKLIKNEYKVHWELDALPAAVPKHGVTVNGKSEYETGFPLGRKDDQGGMYLNNHVNVVVRYNKDVAYGTEPGKMGYRVVGFEVEAQSIDYADDPTQTHPACRPGKQLKVGPNVEAKQVTWTYSVKWVEDKDTLWTQRWDRYATAVDSQIHWFSIVNSLMIVLFLTGMVAMIMMRTLHADLRQYSAQVESNEEVEETGWKLVHGDVFRSPRNPMLFSTIVGFGAQVFASLIITLFFSVLGLMSPANRGGLLTALILLVAFSGIFAGYTSTRLYKMFKGVNWKQNTLCTAMLLPGFIIGIFLVVDMFLLGEHSSGSVPWPILLAIAALWFGVSLPLVFFGSYIAFKKEAIVPPVGTNQIPRQIPDQVWYMSPLLSVLMGGVLPFGAVFIELYYILSAVWGHQMYYIFGFLFIVFLILIVTCAEISIVMAYFQLCSEDYHWWWRSLLTSGASAFYLFLYSTFYFATRLDITSFVSTLLYFGYTTIFTTLFFSVTGFIGFFATWIFVHTIYSAVPFD
jgi:transmembrane 9 superfamily protein 2/4